MSAPLRTEPSMPLTRDDVVTRLRALADLPDGPIPDNANLISLGLDSLAVMRLASHWRRLGAPVSFASLIEQPTLGAWWTQLSAVSAEPSPEPESEAITDFDLAAPFPLTEVQHAYWIGRQDGQSLGGVGCHAYLELDGQGVEVQRLTRAWQLLREHHGMLRARFTDDGEQLIEAETRPQAISLHDLRGMAAADARCALDKVRDRLSHRRLEVERGTVMTLELSLLDEGRTRLHLNLDLLVADVQSLNIILRDLATVYEEGDTRSLRAPSSWHFGRYLADARERRRDDEARAKAYWQERLNTLPGAPGLPLSPDADLTQRPTFKRRRYLLPPDAWRALRDSAAAHAATPANVLLAAYAEVIAYWSSQPRFLLNIPLFDRETASSSVEDVVADFTNLLLLECDFSEALPFDQRLRQVQSRLHADVAHASYSGVSVQRDLARQGLTDGMAAPVVFACNLGTPLTDERTRRVLGCLNEMISQTPQVWLDHQVYEQDDGLLLVWDAVDNLFPAEMVDDMFAAYTGLIDWLVGQAGEWSVLPKSLLPAAQRIARTCVNDTAHSSRPCMLHEPLFDQADLRADQVALIDGDDVLSYGDLLMASRRVAGYLVTLGLKPGTPVAVSLPRGVDQVIAVLGVLAAGGCYVPVGLRQPPSRRAKIHRTAGIEFALCSREQRPEQADEDGVRLIDLEQALDHSPLTTPVEVDPASPAYIIFTSGSTGEPKGVQIAHRAAANTIDDINRRFRIDDRSRGLAVSALDFDLSVYDLFGILGAGGSLVLIDDAQQRDAAAWVELVQRHQVTVWNSVPVLLDMLLVANEGNPLPLQQVLLSGDWIGLDLPARLDACSEARLFALGGATEASIWSNFIEVEHPIPEDWTSIPYGQPLTNQQYRVVDGQGRDCPDWVAGELWIGGSGVADGYRGAPTLTAERFVEHDGVRWYRTGDRGRYWADGTLEFLGRQDHQVKVRGHRIELGEIETALKAQPGVEHAVVVTVGKPASLAAALVITPVPDDTTARIAALRQTLGQALPEYMVPSHIVLLDALPLSANGKVDRGALVHLLSEQHRVSETFEAPEGEVEQKVAALWSRLLGVDRVGRRQRFFELGGDSLLATQVIAELKAQGLGSSQGLRLLFAKPVLADFAAELQAIATQETTAQVRPDLANRHEPFPLTEVQRAYWVGQSTGLPLSCGTHYLVELDGDDVDLPRLEQAWNRLIAHHEMLRAVVGEDGQQRIRETVPASRIRVDEQPLADATTAQHILHEAWAHERGEDELPHRLRAVRYAGNRCRIGVFFDYMMLDGFSIKRVLDELANLYTAPDQTLPELGLSFRDYVCQVAPNEAAVQRASDYWTERLPTLPPAAELPLAKDPQTLPVAHFSRRQAELTAPQWQRLRALASAQDVTPSVLLLTVYAVVLSRWNGGRAHTLNMTLFDRQPVHPDINRVLGDFTSLAPVVFQPRNDDDLRQMTRAMQQEVADALEHRERSSIWVQRALGRADAGANVALPVVFTSTLGLGGGLFETVAPGFPALVAGGLSETPQVWLDHQLYEYQGRLILTWDAVDELFPDGLLDDLFDTYQRRLHALCDSADGVTVDAGLPDEQARVRQRVNTTAAPDRPRALAADVFDRATVEPDCLALIAGEASISFGELADRALRVGGYLHAQGVTTGMPVAVSLPRGVDQVVAVLGVLAAGGCYVPVGLRQPPSRRAKIHRTAGIRFALCGRRQRRELADDDGVRLIDLEQALDHPPLAAPVPVDPSTPAYVIFTSGSTGEPKGVQIAHQAAVNTVDDINRRFGIGAESRGLAVSALDFDLSVYDLFGILGAGGSLVLIDDAQQRDAAAWVDLVQRHGVTVWNSVPVLLDMLLVANEGRSLPLQQVLLSGDWIGLDLPARLDACGEARLFALGGATEASIWSNFIEVEHPIPSEWTSIPYGQPLTNQQYRVVDAHGHDCPDWVAGELWIGGRGIADGYRGAPALSAERFVERDGVRWYRTGDRGRYWADGTLEFLGRQDHQVKVRGHRIELGEIETALKAQPSVEHAVVVTVGKPASLAAALVVAPAPENASAFLAELKRTLELALPDYMVPSDLMLLDALPLSANGKVDRGLLARELGEQRAIPETFEAPEGEREQQVASLWSRLLGLERVGRQQRFFELGGDSLLATQVIAELKAQGLGAPQGLRLLFAKPALADFAAELEVIAASDATPQVRPNPANRHEPFPLTEVQRAYWVGQSTGLPLSCGTHYLVELDGERVDLPRLERALNRLVGRHDMLRVVVGPDRQQRVLNSAEPCRIDLDAAPALDAQDAHERLRHAWSRHRTVLQQGPVLVLKAIRYGQQRCRLGLFLNYLALDGYSIKRLLNELALIYGDETCELPAIEIGFRDYVCQVSPAPQRVKCAEDYWRGRLEDLPPAAALPLACDPQTLPHVRFRRHSARLDAPLWQAIRQQAKAHGITPSVAVLAVYAQVLSRWSGGVAHTLNLTLFDRQPVHPDIDKVLGDFTSLAPVAYAPQVDGSLLAQARTLQQQIAEVLEYREVSSIWVQRERAKRVGAAAAALPVVFTSTLGIADSLFDQPLPPGFPDLVADGGLSQTPQVWLDHQMYEHQGALLFSWDALEELFPAGLIESMFASFVSRLEALATSAWDAPLKERLPTRQAAVRQQVNGTMQALESRALHETLFVQGRTQPQRVALISEDRALRFGELTERALRVAGHLVAQGVEAGTPVAVSLPRGVDQVVAVLGVLAAGGCYVPVGLRQPSSRRAKIHRTAGIELALCGREQWPELADDDGVRLIDLEQALDHPPLAAPVSVDPSAPAYVIFTSGSTGEPKGVQIAHQAAVNTVDDINRRFGIGAESRGLAVSALDFDLSVYDIFGVLGAGGSLVLIDDAQQRDAAAWVDLVQRHQVTVWNSVPVLLDMLLVANEGRSLPLRQVLLSGDWIGLDLPARLDTCGEARLFALGGATEASIWSNFIEVERPIPTEWTSIPYGQPLTNQQYRVVDAHGHDCPDWVAGELWIGGSGVADGYRGAPALTAERFVEHDGSRWYRTGDRGRYWADGTLEFLGRQDHQVKVRGHRIELGEIETALKAQPGVEHAVVVTVGKPASLAAALVVASSPADAAAYIDDLKQALGNELPDYMVPSYLSLLDGLPLSANGKVDRALVLRELQEQGAGAVVSAAPAAGLEAEIAQVWEHVLERTGIGRDDDFFAIGGDSLSATRIVVILQQRLGKEQLSLRVFYGSTPTIAALARHVQQRNPGVASAASDTSLYEEGVI
ncbi:non-ribosomal peptide synthetase [Pseudomonas matsuisoli]|uniref:Carrier domain-containing protein n=1 Tax=Pseudomonas matsuisoli TaxID=1515666 RepID=A0A917PQC2_9PSED|nr:non-ribosomal peptide synthetase [Pseudomonas matsuisoli]GGJ87049.1 hypothetical protein GCM10009304_11240 [Pseudomonas matsuisoli]